MHALIFYYVEIFICTSVSVMSSKPYLGLMCVFFPHCYSS